MGNTIKVLAQVKENKGGVKTSNWRMLWNTEWEQWVWISQGKIQTDAPRVVPLLPDVQIQYYKSAFPTIIICWLFTERRETGL